LTGPDFLDFSDENFTQYFILVSQHDGRDLLNNLEIVFGSKGEQGNERVVFTVADYIVADFRDAVGLVFDEDFEEGLLLIGRLGFGVDVLADSITLDFRRVAGGGELGHVIGGDKIYVNKRFNSKEM
jgi:hypothetical protein